MTESSVSSPFLKQLRFACPNAVILKHHDASFIGLPDCQVIWEKKNAWFEFKLVIPPKRGRIVPSEIAADSPAQHQMMCNLAIQSHFAWYVMWVKKSNRIIVWDPLSNQIIHECRNTPELVEYVSSCLRNLSS